MGHYGSGQFNHSIRGESCPNYKVLNEINVSIVRLLLLNLCSVILVKASWNCSSN